MDSEVVTTFLRNAACHKMLATVIPPQQKGLSFKQFTYVLQRMFLRLNMYPNNQICIYRGLHLNINTVVSASTTFSSAVILMSFYTQLGMSLLKVSVQSFGSGFLQDVAVAVGIRIINMFITCFPSEQ